MNNQIKTAVLFLVYNRPETTSKVFEKIRQSKPLRLYVACDGPREGYLGEMEKINKVREIATKIDWSCEVKTLFREKNLGCKKGVSEAINWFFEHEEEGIILEDDCVPNKDFFRFCEILLDYYSKDESVSLITGNNFQNGKIHGKWSYYFSIYPHCWGWATWKRSWNNFDGNINFWPEWKSSKEWITFMPDKAERTYWNKIFDLVYDDKIDSWALPWTASLWYKMGLTATPNVNLSSNIGFGEDSTHTKNKFSKLSKIPVKRIGEITHPKKIERNYEADLFTFNKVFNDKRQYFPYNYILLFYKTLISIIRKIINIVK